MVMSSQFHIPTTLYPRKKTMVATKQDVGRVLEQVWTCREEKISSLLEIETPIPHHYKKSILPPAVSLCHQHTLTTYDVHFQGRNSTIFLFFNPKLWVILPQKRILPCLTINCSFIQSINQSQSRVMTASGEKAFSSLKIYLSQFSSWIPLPVCEAEYTGNYTHKPLLK